MSVPKGRRNLSRFEAQHNFYKLRSAVTELALLDFGFSEKKYREQIEYEDIELSFMSWLGDAYKYMSNQQIINMLNLYRELFGRIPQWKKHSRLRWLTAQSSTTSD